MALTGIIFALLALLSWGFGDFLIQRLTRKIGDFETLFFIGIAGTIGLFPFIVSELPSLFSHGVSLLLLSITGLVVFFAALFDFEALKRGKIAIVEPILGIELPIAVGLSAFFLGETLSLPQGILAFTVFIGIVLAVTVHHTHLHYHRRIFEKGVVLAGIGAIAMGMVNF